MIKTGAMGDGAIWLTRLEAAQRAKVSESMIGRWMRRGMPHIKTSAAKNAAVRIPAQDMDEWLRSQMQTA